MCACVCISNFDFIEEIVVIMASIVIGEFKNLPRQLKEKKYALVSLLKKLPKSFLNSPTTIKVNIWLFINCIEQTNFCLLSTCTWYTFFSSICLVTLSYKLCSWGELPEAGVHLEEACFNARKILGP